MSGLRIYGAFTQVICLTFFNSLSLRNVSLAVIGLSRFKSAVCALVLPPPMLALAVLGRRELAGLKDFVLLFIEKAGEGDLIGVGGREEGGR